MHKKYIHFCTGRKRNRTSVVVWIIWSVVGPAADVGSPAIELIFLDAIRTAHNVHVHFSHARRQAPNVGPFRRNVPTIWIMNNNIISCKIYTFIHARFLKYHMYNQEDWFKYNWSHEIKLTNVLVLVAQKQLTWIAHTVCVHWRISTASHPFVTRHHLRDTDLGQSSRI